MGGRLRFGYRSTPHPFTFEKELIRRVKEIRWFIHCESQTGHIEGNANKVFDGRLSGCDEP